MRRLSRACTQSVNLAGGLPKGCQKQKMRRKFEKSKVPKSQRFRDFFGGLGEKIRTSGLLNPIQARYQTALHPVMFRRFRLSPKGSTLRTELIIACFQRPVKRENVFFYDFLRSSAGKQQKLLRNSNLFATPHVLHQLVEVLNNLLRVVAFFCVILDLLEKLIETLICHVQCHFSVK